MSRAGSLVWTERWKRIGIDISPFRSILHLKHIGSFVHMGCDSSAFIIPASGNAKRKQISRGEVYYSWSAGGDWGVGACEVDISSPV